MATGTVSAACGNGCPNEIINEVSDYGPRSLTADLVVSWDTFAPIFLLWPLLFQFVVVVPLMLLMQLVYKSCHHSKGCRSVLAMYFGTIDHPTPEKPLMISCFYFLQLVTSLATVVLWAMRTVPPHTLSSAQENLELVFAIFYVAHYIVRCIRHGFTISNTMTSASLIDVFTTLPYFVPLDINLTSIERPWLSLSFLRSYRALISYQAVENMGVLDVISDFNRAIIRMILRLLALIVTMGGTVFTLEVLGELEAFQDLSVTTDMGDLSFVQMSYWIMTTISTVGYGDFSPTTVFCRIVVSIFIVVGVVFFSIESSKLTELQSLLEQGKGSYKDGVKNNHVVVVGRNACTYSTLVIQFLEEVLHIEHEQHGWPDVVLMSENPIDPDLKSFVATSLPLRARSKVKFFCGSALNDEDLDRVQIKFCQFGLVLCDTDAADVNREDQSCIMRVMAMKKYHSSFNTRLVVVQPESKRYALNVGIKAERCFSTDQLKASIMMQSCRIHGFVPFLTNLLRSEPGPPEDLQLDQCVEEYLHGKSHEVCGFLVPKEYEGMPFQDLAAIAFEKFSLPLVGLQIKGRIMVLPLTHKLVDGDVCLAIATSPEHCHLLAKGDSGKDWRKILNGNREQFLYLNDYEHELGHQMLQHADKHGEFQSFAKAGADIAAGGDGAAAARRKSYSQSHTISKFQERNVNRDFWLKQAEAFRKRKGFITMIIASPDPIWQQITSCLEEMRRDYLPFQQPVILLTSCSPPCDFRDLLKEFTDVALIIGPPHQVDTLLRAGILESAAVVVLSGGQHVQEGSQQEQDSSGLTLARSIEHLLAVKTVVDKPLVLFEFRSENSTLLLPPSLPESAVNDAMTLAPFSVSKTEELAERPDQDVQLHPRSLAGHVFTPDFFGSLLGRMYYFPATIEFVEAIVMPGQTGQNSFLWQTRVPKDLHDKSFLQLFMEYIKRKQKPAAAAIALYRQSPSSPEASYIVTNPQPNTILRFSDMVVWLGPEEFGMDMHQAGFLLAGEWFAPWGENPSKGGVHDVDLTLGGEPSSPYTPSTDKKIFTDAPKSPLQVMESTLAAEMAAQHGEVEALKQSVCNLHEKFDKHEDLVLQLQKQMNHISEQLADLSAAKNPTGNSETSVCFSTGKLRRSTGD